MTDIKTKEAFRKLEDAIQSLSDILEEPMDPKHGMRDAAILRLRHSFELFWKYLKCLLETRGLELRFPKDVLREAFMGKIIDHEEQWIEMLRDRNLTSHTYNEDLAEQIYQHTKNIYYPLMRSSLESLKASQES